MLRKRYARIYLYEILRNKLTLAKKRRAMKRIVKRLALLILLLVLLGASLFSLLYRYPASTTQNLQWTRHQSRSNGGGEHPALLSNGEGVTAEGAPNNSEGNSEGNSDELASQIGVGSTSVVNSEQNEEARKRDFTLASSSSPPLAVNFQKSAYQKEESYPLTAGEDSCVTLCNHWLGDTQTTCSNWGFALSLSFWDQQTWACGNVLGMQHWAKSLNIAVVQPFLVNTTLQIPSVKIEPSHLPLSKLYDMDHWNDYSAHNNYAPTVTWDCFLNAAPRKLILVYLKGYGGTCERTELRDKSGLLLSLGFQVVRELCITAQPHHRLAISEFSEKILGNFSAHEVTIAFQEWSQRAAGDILDMDEAHLPMALVHSLPLKPSKWIESDADAYISRYLKNDFVAILLRVEWLTMYSSLVIYNKTVSDSLNRTLSFVNAARCKVGTDSIFLGMDIGQYGSRTIKTPNSEIARQVIERHFFHSIYPDPEMTISKWEHSFEEVSQSEVPGYIALLQKTVAVRGKCLLMIGSGSFQKHALELYKSLHPRKSEQCLLTTTSHGDIHHTAGLREYL